MSASAPAICARALNPRQKEIYTTAEVLYAHRPLASQLGNRADKVVTEAQQRIHGRAEEGGIPLIEQLPIGARLEVPGGATIEVQADSGHLEVNAGEITSWVQNAARAVDGVLPKIPGTARSGARRSRFR